MKASTMIRAGAIAFAAMFAAEPARAALTLIAVGGGGGGAGAVGAGAGGVISESGTSSGGGGAGGTAGLGGAGVDGGGGAGWLGNGGSGGVSAGGISAPTFAGGAGLDGTGNGGFGGGGGSGFNGGGGGGDSGGGGSFNGGGGGGSYLNPVMRDTIQTPDFNGVAGLSPSNGYVIVGLTVFNYTGAVVEYTIPTTGFYYVAAVGAQGGSSISISGGYGAGVGGSVLLDAGTELDIVVGGAGTNDIFELFNGGGGGGSFVWDPTAVPPQPVPEPSAWAMMLIGFGGLGYAGFRRRRVALAAPAGLA